MHARLDRAPPDGKTVLRALYAVPRNIDDQIERMPEDQVHDIRRFLLRLADLKTADPRAHKALRSPSRGINAESHLLKALCDRDHFLLVLVAHRHDHVPVMRQIDPGPPEGFPERLLKILRYAEAFSGGLHFRSEGDVRALYFFK